MIAQVVIENGQKKVIPLTADAGAGAPVGSIIVVCSNILPSGYLGLGVQYDPTNYPALYQVLGTDTTPTASALGLPTLSSGQYAIKATSGLTENQQENVLNTINENNSYSTEEHLTGKKWIDGKPIYRKVETVNDMAGVKDSWVSTGVTIPNVETLINVISLREGQSTRDYIGALNYEINNSMLSYYIVGDTFAGKYKLIIEYTKTTD